MEFIIDNLEYVAFTFMGVIVVYMSYQVLTKGFKGSLFKGKILQTYGEFKTLRVSGITNRIKVHEIDSKPERTIGIEVSGPFEVTPIRLNKKDIPKLIEILKITVKES